MGELRHVVQTINLFCTEERGTINLRLKNQGGGRQPTSARRACIPNAAGDPRLAGHTCSLAAAGGPLLATTFFCGGAAGRNEEAGEAARRRSRRCR